MLVSLGIGLTTLAAIALIQGNLRQQIARACRTPRPPSTSSTSSPIRPPSSMPWSRAVPGVTEVRRVPSLRARDRGGERRAGRSGAGHARRPRWALRGDRGLTYAAAAPEGTRVVAGAMVAGGLRGPAPGLPRRQPRARLACRSRRHDHGERARPRHRPADRLPARHRVARAGAELRPHRLARRCWRRRRTPTSPPCAATPAQETALLRAVTDALPNVSGIRVRDALEAVAALLAAPRHRALRHGRRSRCVSGLLVLAGAVAAGQRRRDPGRGGAQDLGATRAQIRAAWLVEFGLLGAVAGLIAAAAGTAGLLGGGALRDAGGLGLPARHACRHRLGMHAR